MNQQLFMIWSHEHSAWWKQNLHGYDDALEEAGCFTIEQALQITLGANVPLFIAKSGEPRDSIVPVPSKS